MTGPRPGTVTAGRCCVVLPPSRDAGLLDPVGADGAPGNKMAGRKRRCTCIFAFACADRSRILLKQQFRSALREASAYPELKSGFAQCRTALIQKRSQMSILV